MPPECFLRIADREDQEVKRDHALGIAETEPGGKIASAAGRAPAADAQVRCLAVRRCGGVGSSPAHDGGTMADHTRPVAASFGDAMRMIRGFVLSQALHVAAKLSLSDRLRDGPMSARDLATASGAHAVALHRLMRFLTTEYVLHENGDGRFRCGAIGELLRSNHPQSARAQAVMYGEPLLWRPWGDLYETVMSGTPGFDRVYGQSFFEHLASHPDPEERPPRNLVRRQAAGDGGGRASVEPA